MRKIIFTIYLIFQLFLYSAILFIDINISNKILTYSVILLNFIFGIYILSAQYNDDTIISTVALFFTLIADTFLVLLDNKLLGVISFNFVQIFYMLKVKNLITKKNKVLNITRFSSLTLFSIILFFLTLKNFDFLIFTTGLYFIMLVFNFIESIPLYKKNLFVPLGFILFILCDVFVGLGFLEDSININFIKKIMDIDFNFIWFFYTPSQVFLTISMINKKWLDA